MVEAASEGALRIDTVSSVLALDGTGEVLLALEGEISSVELLCVSEVLEEVDILKGKTSFSRGRKLDN